YGATFNLVPISTVAVVLVLCGAMVGALFSADAWGNVTFIAGEVKDPKRNLPRSLFLGTGLVILLYILANIAYLAALPLKSNELEAVRLVAEAKDIEYKASVYYGNIRHLEAQVARTQIELFQLEQILAQSPPDDEGLALVKRQLEKEKWLISIYEEKIAKD